MKRRQRTPSSIPSRAVAQHAVSGRVEYTDEEIALDEWADAYVEAILKVVDTHQQAA